MAGRYAVVIASSILGMTILRLILDRVLSAETGNWIGSVILAAVCGLLWFALTFFCLLRALRGDGENSLAVASSADAKQAGGFLSTLTSAAGIACVLSLTAWLALDWNDAIFYSRSLPWIAPLITVQHSGFVAASRLYPCQAEGSNTGCEPYKWIPTFLIANALAYFPFVFGGVLWYRLSKAARTNLQSVALQAVRWAAPVVVIGLCALLVMHKLNLDTHDSLFPHPGIAHWHLGVWELLNDITGTVIVLAGLLLPFCFYRAFRKNGGLSVTRSRLSELTALTIVMLAALMLGNVY
jgi:hypothetical protein